MLIQRGMAAFFLLAVGALCGFCLPKDAFQARAARFGRADLSIDVRVATAVAGSRGNDALRPT